MPHATNPKVNRRATCSSGEQWRRVLSLQPHLLQPFCLVLLQMGFTQPVSHLTAGKLLPHHFTLTDTVGGMFLWHFP